MVPPASHKLTGVRGTQDSNQAAVHLLYGTLTHSGGAFQRLPVEQSTACAGPTTPAAFARAWFGLIPLRSPLPRDSRLISLRRATEMFQFAHGPPPSLCIQLGVSRHHSGRVAPFGLSGLSARMQLPLNVSPVSASFVGLQRLGIHPALVLACACLRSRSRVAADRHPCLCLRSSASLLSSCLGNIEVILLFGCARYGSCPRQLKSGNQPAHWHRHPGTCPQHSSVCFVCLFVWRRGSTWEWLLSDQKQSSLERR